MTITTYTDREIALKVERDTLRQQLAEAQALIEASRKQQPVAWQYQLRDGTWSDFLNDKHYDDTKAKGTWPIRCLYAAPRVADDVPSVNCDTCVYHYKDADQKPCNTCIHSGDFVSNFEPRITGAKK